MLYTAAITTARIRCFIIVRHMIKRQMEQAARNMLADGFSVEKIARLTGLSEAHVQKLASEQ